MMTAIHAVGADAPHPSTDAALAAALDAPLPDLRTGDCVPGDGLVLAAFLRPHLHGLHPYLVERDLPGAVDVVDVLPEPAHVLRLHRRNGTTEVMATHEGCLLVVRSWRRNADVWVSGTDRDEVERIAAAVHAKVRRPAKRQGVRVTFWHHGNHSWTRSRVIAVPKWTAVAGLYPAVVRDTMARLLEYRPDPARPGGRLILWHGPPGTGKTTAVRALFDAWRGWASAHVVSDPESLLSNGDYMARVLLDPDDDDKAARWRLVVIEDAEELLRRDARSKVGPGLGRLLNTADGLLGQGSRVLVLLTTNEPVDDMHPALLRPGRCLARMDFPAFDITEAAGLLGDRPTGPMTLAEIMERKGRLTRLEATTSPTRPGNYL